MSRLAIAALAALGLALVAARLVAIGTEAINWDELALFARAARATEAERLDGGGRPALATLALVPVVDGCEHAIGTARAARWLWVVPTVGSLAALFVLLGQLARRRASWRWSDAALGVGLLALVPIFHRWSVQVRSDQLAVAGALWSGVALLASRRRPAWAAAAGALLGVGLLSSPKALYLGVLVAALALGEAWLERDLRWRRELARAGLAALGLAAVVLAYLVFVRLAFTAPPRLQTVGGQLDTFAWYRQIVGFRVYRAMLPSLTPHLLVGGLALIASIVALRAGGDGRREIVLPWVVALLGVAIGWFHAAAFPYFWMTLGVFPAVALALALAPIRALLASDRRARWLTGGLWLLLVAIATPGVLDALRDTQAVQRDSLALVERDLPASARGFQLDGALYCRRDPAPFPVLLREHVVRLYSGPPAAANVAALIAEFRRRPVAFVIGSHRMSQFPRELKTFWRTHYVPYRGTVMLAGARLAGAVGERVPFELIAGGRFRWWVTDPRPAGVTIDGAALAPGGELDLAAGPHVAVLAGPVSQGSLVLAVPTPPAPRDARELFSATQLDEITGRD
jgi:hypothetical protein